MSVEQIFDNLSYEKAEESEKEAMVWLNNHDRKFGHFINGTFYPFNDKSFIETRNPAREEVLASVSLGTHEDIDQAVKAARKAQKAWASLSGHQRAKYLYALARVVQRNARLISVVEALDNGKSIRETRDIDIPLAARHFYHHAGWAQLQHQEFADYLPIGVIGQIVPWNFPFLMLAWKVAPALAMGNTVVLKSAEYTPLTALLFAELASQCNLPKGVFNVVSGDGTTGSELVKHKDINKIAFTGSTEVGRIIRKETAGSGKSLTLELGGKSPFIVFDDADIDGAVEGVVDAIWFNQGQVCCAGSRLLLHRPIVEQFTARLKRRMDNLRLGDPLDKCIDMGAVIDPVQWKRIDDLVQKGVSQGAKLFRSSQTVPKSGCFYPPTLLSEVEPGSIVAQEEIFGPVAVSMTFRTPDEAVALANNSRYGLAASVWSESIGQSMDVASKLKAGVVWVNATNMFDAAVGFGGYRESGFGREGGREGIFEYLKPMAWAARKPYSKKPTLKGNGLPITSSTQNIDRTAKLFIGGKQVRPDGNYSRNIFDHKGYLLGSVGEGNRKDIRNAVEAARKAEGWSVATPHMRAQILFYIAENLSARRDEFAERLRSQTGEDLAQAQKEVDLSLSRLFSYGAWSDKFEGAVHVPPIRGVALAMPEPIGVVGLLCPREKPLLALISLAAPLIAMGNRIVVIPSDQNPLIATDFYSVLETSDLPAGVLNIVTGDEAVLGKTLAEHLDVEAIWCFSNRLEISKMVQFSSAGNLKRTLVNDGLMMDWEQAEGRDWLHHAVQVKNIWIPYGE